MQEHKVLIFHWFPNWGLGVKIFKMNPTMRQQVLRDFLSNKPWVLAKRRVHFPGDLFGCECFARPRTGREYPEAISLAAVRLGIVVFSGRKIQA